jgi:hypothetical protein
MNTIKILKVGIAAAFFLAAITCTKDPVSGNTTRLNAKSKSGK